MRTHLYSLSLLACGLLAVNGTVKAANSPVPEPFQGFDTESGYSIRYDDLTALYNSVVLDVGRSTREKSAPAVAKTGTRMKASVKRSTANEGNRFYYEIFKGNAENQEALRSIRDSLAQIPDEVPLKYFSRDEQLAYWINLYNLTLLDEIIKIYPERKLKKTLLGKKSILEKEVLTVSGIPLSLNDIQHTILKHNYDNDPVIIYGLYQGIVGGPNIRKNAYTGENVYRNLAKNAVDFANSNRGTASQSEKVFRVSSLYDRNRAYFPDFKPDLTAHLLQYLEGDERREIQAAKSLKPDINDWTITDLYGTFQRIGGSLADNNAALLDSVRSYTQGGGVPTSNVGMSTMLVTKTTKFDRVSPELLDLLTEMQLKTEMANTDKATVTVEEMGEVQEDTDPATDPDVREE